MTEIEFRYTLSKDERLSHEKRIDALFAGKADSFVAYPLRVVYLVYECKEGTPLVSILTSVSKKKFKRAVKRNRVKRLIRESYRLNKRPFTEIATQINKSIDIAFLYLKNELPEYSEIEKAILKTSTVLTEKLLETKADESNP